MRGSLLILLAVAAFLRFWGLCFGLDLSDVSGAVLNDQVDERGMVQAELDGLLHGHLHPGDFLHRGAGAYYVLGALDAAALALPAAIGEGGWQGQLARLDANPSLLHLLHRIWSALSGVASVALIVAMCRRELSGRAALLAGALLATAYLHVRESHFGTVDVLWGLLTLATLDQALRLLRDPSPRRYVVTGLLAGATAATKYFGVLLVLHLLVSHVAARRAAREGGRPAPGTARLMLGLACMPAGFVVLSPYLFFAAGDLLDMVRWSAGNIGADPSAGGLMAALGHHVHWTLAVGLGEPVFALALIGGVMAWRRGGAARLLSAYAVLLLPCLLLTGHQPVRFGLALLVMMVPLAAIAADEALRRWAGRPLLGVALIALVMLPSTLRSLAFDRMVGGRDTRLEMLQAIAERGAAPADVVAVGLYGLPRVHEHTPMPYTDLYGRNRRGEGPTLAEVQAAPPRFILRDLCSGLPDALGWDPIAPLVNAHYREVLRLEPRPDPGAVTLPDPAAGTPTHMIPYGNPWAMERPGSALVLYERTER